MDVAERAHSPTSTFSGTVESEPLMDAGNVLPKNFIDRSRIEQNLFAFLAAATHQVMGTPKVDALKDMIGEATSVLQHLQRSDRNAAAANSELRGSPAKPSLSGSTTGCGANRKLLLSMRSTCTHAASDVQSVAESVDGLPEPLKYLAAACRAPASRVLALLERSSAEGSLCATVELGTAITFGIGCSASPERGLALLDRGVSLGHPGAMQAVATCLRSAIGVPLDVVGALHWLRRAAELEYVFAQHELAEIYEDGEAGVARSLPIALRWYKRAATSGYSSSQLNLGKLMLMGAHVDVGDVVHIDPSVVPAWNELRMKAMYWLSAAASRGNAEARQLLERSMGT